MSDDIVYLSLLFFSIIFGYVYRPIEDVEYKKRLGTIVGFSIIFIVSGLHIIHPLITTVINAIIILYVPRRKCHLVSLIFTFSYLLFFRTTIYFGIPYPPSHTNLIQMILTLKLVGLAFEANSSSKEDLQLSFIDIIHYAFNYIGVLTGPHYKYQTFMDYFSYPYYKYANWKDATLQKIKYIPLWAVLYLLSTYLWPVSYASTEEFYNERSWLYRQWFIWPSFFIFRMRIYIGIVLSECVCTMAGFGAYPVETESEKPLEQIDYTFKTILNLNPYGSEFCTTYREGMKHWNICVQTWLAENIYKRFPFKKYRTIATLLVSAYWHGVYLGYYVCIGTVPFCLMIEDVWVKLYDKNNKLYQWIHYILKMHFFGYQAIAFLLLDVDKIVHYYNSIYHATLIFGIILYVVGLVLLSKRKERTKET